MGGRGAISGRKLPKMRFVLDIQTFAFGKDESDVYRQTNTSLRKGIRKLKKRVIEHESKIKNLELFYPDFYSLDVREQEGQKKHWRKEIVNFKRNIEIRKKVLADRGEPYEEE